VWRLVVVESSLYVDAIDGIVDAVLNVPEIAHDSFSDFSDVHRSARSKNANWRTVVPLRPAAE
jgi:hypothetical protein